jgi:Rieske Fe-S protein
MADSHEVQRRDFVNIVLVGIGSVIGLIIGIPAIAYLLSPAVKVQEEEAWIPLGPLDVYPLDDPTLFSYTRTKINGWEKTVNSYGAYVWRYAGPPPEPLFEFETKVEEGVLSIKHLEV